MKKTNWRAINIDIITSGTWAWGWFKGGRGEAGVIHTNMWTFQLYIVQQFSSHEKTKSSSSLKGIERQERALCFLLFQFFNDTKETRTNGHWFSIWYNIVNLSFDLTAFKSRCLASYLQFFSLSNGAQHITTRIKMLLFCLFSLVPSPNKWPRKASVNNDNSFKKIGVINPNNNINNNVGGT